MNTHCLQRDLLVCGATTKCPTRYRNRHINVSKVHSWAIIHSMVQWNIGQKLDGVMNKQTKQQINKQMTTHARTHAHTLIHLCLKSHFFVLVIFRFEMHENVFDCDMFKTL